MSYCGDKSFPILPILKPVTSLQMLIFKWTMPAGIWELYVLARLQKPSTVTHNKP